MKRTFAAMALTMIAGLAAATAAQAQTTLTVNTTADTTASGDCVTSGSPCSLRDAIDVVNANTPAGDFTIVVPPGHYVLTAGALDLTNAGGRTITISGAGARTTSIDAGGASRVLYQGSNSNDNLSLSGLTITGGAATPTSTFPAGDGGGIVFQGTGTLTLDHVAVVNNTATLGGGGVFVPFEQASPGGPESTVDITASTIAGNKVTGGLGNGQGGGMAIFGPLTMTNSTVSGNTVGNPGTNEGGGIAGAREAGDTGTTAIPITLLNDTIAGNSISGAGAATDFGGGLSGDDIGGTPSESQLAATNTIIAGNSVDGAEADCALVNVTSTDHNLSGDSSCGFSDAGSLQNTNARLAPLADNGGQTDTQALTAVSPAINAGTNAGCPATDQIGTTRPQDGICDIGAVERIRTADVSVAAGASPASVDAGGQVTYTIAVTNNGPDPANAVTLSDTLGADQTLVSATSSQGTCAGSAPIGCSIGTLTPGASVRVTVVATTASAAAGRVVTDTATAATTSTDPDPANNTASASASVLAAHAPVVTTSNSSRRGPRGCVAGALALPVRITSTSRITRVRVTLNGRTVVTTTRTRFTVRVPARRLRSGRNVILVTATNAAGRVQRHRTTIVRCGRASRARPHRRVPRFTG